ncbi:MAG TPA: hypothetical protein VF170_08295 [Planctomycetaceae bacterium]
MTAPFPVAAPHEPAAQPGRLVAWVDGAGAFLLCLGETATLGGLSGKADVRLTADLSARHAAIHRSGEGYVVEATGPAVVASEPRAGDVGPPSLSHDGHAARRGSGRVVRDRTDLNNGDELVLYRDGGGGVRLLFRRPNVLTATATLSVASEHRTEPRFDGVVLLADACLFGPGREAHVRCRNWEETVLLFRRDGGLWCKSPLPLAVGGRPANGPAPVGPGDHVTGPGISFRLESA